MSRQQQKYPKNFISFFAECSLTGTRHNFPISNSSRDTRKKFPKQSTTAKIEPLCTFADRCGNMGFSQDLSRWPTGTIVEIYRLHYGTGNTESARHIEHRIQTNVPSNIHWALCESRCQGEFKSLFSHFRSHSATVLWKQTLDSRSSYISRLKPVHHRPRTECDIFKWAKLWNIITMQKRQTHHIWDRWRHKPTEAFAKFTFFLPCPQGATGTCLFEI